jgi:uncharacterized protein DUF397
MTGNTTWRKSSYSGGSGGNCVEVRRDTGRVLVRDTKDRTGAVLPFTPEAWRRFADRVKRSLAGPRQASIYGHPRVVRVPVRRIPTTCGLTVSPRLLQF